MNSPCAAHNAEIARLARERDAAQEEIARLNAAWQAKWEATIDTYSSLLHKEQDALALARAEIEYLKSCLRSEIRREGERV